MGPDGTLTLDGCCRENNGGVGGGKFDDNHQKDSNGTFPPLASIDSSSALDCHSR